MTCPLCNDTGWKRVDQDGTRRVVRCDCWYGKLSSRLLEDAKIPPRYEQADLNRFVSYNPSLENAVAQAKRFVEAFPVVDRGLLLLGLAGVGKTHLASAILKEVIREKGARGCFFHTPDLLRLIRSTYNPLVKTAEMDVLKPVLEADLLVLDDLGAEKLSDWVEETMNLIVNTRYNQKKATIFTSNFIDTPDDTDPNTLVFRVGFRIRSRLFEMCTIVEIDAADYRVRPPDASIDDLVMLWKRGRPSKKPLPTRSGGQVKAQFRDGRADLKWPGGRAGS